MAIVTVKVPKGVAQILHRIPVPGKLEPEETKHITVAYLGKDVPLETLGTTIVSMAQALAHVEPFSCTLKGYTCFPEGDDGVPIICPVESPGLHTMRKKLVGKLEANGVEYSKKFPVYKPHVTLSYNKKAVPSKSFQPLTWTAHEVTLWGGEDGEERLTANIPLTTGKTATKPSIERLLLSFFTKASVG